MYIYINNYIFSGKIEYLFSCPDKILSINTWMSNWLSFPGKSQAVNVVVFVSHKVLLSDFEPSAARVRCTVIKGMVMPGSQWAVDL